MVPGRRPPTRAASASPLGQAWAPTVSAALPGLPAGGAGVGHGELELGGTGPILSPQTLKVQAPGTAEPGRTRLCPPHAPSLLSILLEPLAAGSPSGCSVCIHRGPPARASAGHPQPPWSGLPCGPESLLRVATVPPFSCPLGGELALPDIDPQG